MVLSQLLCVVFCILPYIVAQLFRSPRESLTPRDILGNAAFAFLFWACITCWYTLYAGLRCISVNAPVVSVAPGSIAERAGLKAGDLLDPTSDFTDWGALQSWSIDHPSPRAIPTLHVLRRIGDRTESFPIILRDRPTVISTSQLGLELPVGSHRVPLSSLPGVLAQTLAHGAWTYAEAWTDARDWWPGPPPFLGNSFIETFILYDASFVQVGLLTSLLFVIAIVFYGRVPLTSVEGRSDVHDNTHIASS